MNGNTPYAGRPGSTTAGHRTDEDLPELSPDQRRSLRRGVTGIAARTREFLPDEYVVGAEVRAGVGGPQATVAVQPPVGPAVSADFTPDRDDLADEDAISEGDREEVARGLAAQAALQVKQTVGDSVSPTAR